MAQNATQYLPVLDREIGDTWAYGIPSDPLKRSQGAVMMRARTACLASGACSLSTPAIYNFSRLLVKLPEHTDGRDVKTFLHDNVDWSNEQLQSALAEQLPNFEIMIDSWNEQRNFSLYYPLAALQQEWLPPAQRDASALTLAQVILDGWAELAPSASTATRAQSVLSSNRALRAVGSNSARIGQFQVGWDTTTGAITTFTDTVSRIAWASAARPLLQVEYQTYTADDFSSYIANYSSAQPPPSWFMLDFGKPNSTGNHTVATTSLLQAITPPSGGVELYLRVDRDAATLQTLAVDQHVNVGAPAVIVLQLVADASNPASINVTWSFVNKTATRLPEAMFLRTNPTPAGSGPPAPEASLWRYHTLGQAETDPAYVQLGGNRHFHATDGRVTFYRASVGSSPKLSYTLVDSLVMAFGAPTGFPTPIDAAMDAEIASEGAAIYAWGNLWGTNYVEWFPFLAEDASFVARMQITTA